MATYTVSQVTVPQAAATELVPVTSTCTGIRITYNPKTTGQLLYLGSSSAVTNTDGYPIPPGVEYQLPAITATALYGYIAKGEADVRIEVFS